MHPAPPREQTPSLHFSPMCFLLPPGESRDLTGISTASVPPCCPSAKPCRAPGQPWERQRAQSSQQSRSKYTFSQVMGGGRSGGC